MASHREGAVTNRRQPASLGPARSLLIGALLLPLLPGGALAGPLEESSRNLIRSSLFYGDADGAIKALDDREGLLLSRPDLVLEICRYASDAAFLLRPGLEGDEPAALAERLERFAAGARASPAARWAKAEVPVLRARLGLRFGTAPAEDLLMGADEVVGATEGTDLAEQGLLRAVDLHLEAAPWEDAREKALEGLAALAKRAEADESISKAGRAAARAALLLEGDGPLDARIDEGLALLTPFRKAEIPDQHVVRRHNDFVTLARGIGRKEEYCMVPLDSAGGYMTFRAPLSRRWRVLHGGPTGEWRGYFLLNPDGTLRFKVGADAYVPDQKYPIGAEKQALGRQTRKLAEAYLAADKARWETHDTKGIRKARLGPKTKDACGYELLGVFAGSSTRIRAWFFRGEDWSYGIRIDEEGPGFEADCPELEAMLATLAGK